MSGDDVVLPAVLIQSVEQFVDECVERAARFDNAELLDEDDVFRLHRLAASVYARGWQDGAMAERERGNGVRRRERAAQRRDGGS